MKKLLLSIVALCATMSVYSQSVKSIRINGHDQKHSYISISDIDSITYDIESQSQVIWANSMDRKIPLSAIESVCFESFDTKFSYVENIGEGLDALYNKDGYVAVFGFKNILGHSNSDEEERILFIAKVNESGMIDESDATTVIVDSTFFPVRIVSNELNVVLSKKDDNHFDCLFYNQDTDEWEESKNLEMSSTFTSFLSASRSMRAMSTGGSTNFNLTNAITALSALRNVGGVMTAEGVGKVAPGVGLFGDAASTGGLDEVGLMIGATVAGNWVGALLAAAGYISSKYDKLKKRVFGNDVKISIEDIKQTDRKSFTVSYSVDGLNERGLAHSGLFFSLLNFNKMQRSVIILPTKNGYDEKQFTDMNAGSYEIDMTLISEEYPFLRYVTKPTVEFTIFDLELDRYEIKDNPSYSNGTVNFKMNVYLKGSEDGLGDIQQFGYYTRYSNAIPDYKQVSHLSKIFESTPLTYELPIEREGFFEENRNYNTFEAKATGYYIGAYIVLKNSNIVTIGEQEIEGLVFREKPTAKTGDYVSVTSTSAVVKTKYEYCTFWNATCGIEYTNNDKTETLIVFPNNEGEQEINLTELMPNTTYKYRAFYEVKGKKEYGEYKSFKTKKKDEPDPDPDPNPNPGPNPDPDPAPDPDPEPIAITGTHYDETATTATIECTYENVPAGADCGYYLRGQKGSTVIGSISKSFGNVEGTKIAKLTDLKPAATYYYQAYAHYKGEEHLGSENSFQTSTPSAVTGEYSDVTSNKATIVCGYYDVPSGAITGVKLSYNGQTDELPYSYGEGDHSIDVDNLYPGTTYTYSAYIKYESDYYEGSSKQFTTLTPSAYVGEATDVEEKTAQFEYGFSNVPTGGTCHIALRQDGGETYDYSVSDVEKYVFQLSGLQPGTTYTYWAYVDYYGEKWNSNSGGVTTKEMPLCPDSNHPHWIDLGLPSGTQWRCCNEGASTPEAYGGYYLFGQVSNAPTLEQCEELVNCCTSEWTTLNGVNGRKFTGPNGSSIFLSAAGDVWGGDLNGELQDVGLCGGYWSSTPEDENFAFDLYFHGGFLGTGNWNIRSGVQPVRPVRR